MARWLGPVLCLLVVSTTSWAQNDDGKLIRFLLGSSGKRQWVQTRWESILSPTDVQQCKQGKLWTFGSDNLLVITECVAQRARQRRGRWELRRDKRGAALMVSFPADKAVRYRANFRRKPSRVEGDPPINVVILRSPRRAQGEPLHEITLEFQEH